MTISHHKPRWSLSALNATEDMSGFCLICESANNLREDQDVSVWNSSDCGTIEHASHRRPSSYFLSFFISKMVLLFFGTSMTSHQTLKPPNHGLWSLYMQTWPSCKYYITIYKTTGSCGLCILFHLMPIDHIHTYKALQSLMKRKLTKCTFLRDVIEKPVQVHTVYIKGKWRISCLFLPLETKLVLDPGLFLQGRQIRPLGACWFCALWLCFTQG